MLFFVIILKGDKRGGTGNTNWEAYLFFYNLKPLFRCFVIIY